MLKIFFEGKAIARIVANKTGGPPETRLNIVTGYPEALKTLFSGNHAPQAFAGMRDLARFHPLGDLTETRHKIILRPIPEDRVGDALIADATHVWKRNRIGRRRLDSDARPWNDNADGLGEVLWLSKLRHGDVEYARTEILRLQSKHSASRSIL